jgi:hypothetical protein
MKKIKRKYKAKSMQTKTNVLSFQGRLTEKKVAEKCTPHDLELKLETCRKKYGYHC